MKEGDKGSRAEQSRSQAAGQDHLRARSVSFASSPLQLSPLSTLWQRVYPYADMPHIQTNPQLEILTLMEMCYTRA